MCLGFWVLGFLGGLRVVGFRVEGQLCQESSQGTRMYRDMKRHVIGTWDLLMGLWALGNQLETNMENGHEARAVRGLTVGQ